jgi:hypothetical protein
LQRVLLGQVIPYHRKRRGTLKCAQTRLLRKSQSSLCEARTAPFLPRSHTM